MVAVRPLPDAECPYYCGHDAFGPKGSIVQQGQAAEPKVLKNPLAARIPPKVVRPLLEKRENGKVIGLLHIEGALIAQFLKTGWRLKVQHPVIAR